MNFRFVDTYRFSPVALKKDLPAKSDYYHVSWKSFPNTEKKFVEFLNEGGYYVDEFWWHKHRQRCLEGFEIKNAIEPGGDWYREGVNIDVYHEKGKEHVYFRDLDITVIDRTVRVTGKHYFYLNFWYIKGLDKQLGRKDVIHPDFTDLSWENWWIRDRMRREKKDNLWAKRRQSGLSEEEACHIAYEFLFFNSSQNAILGGEDFYNENTMNFVKRGLSRLINTQFDKWKAPDRSEYTRSRYSGAEIYSRTCKNNEQGASGLSPSLCVFEEIGIWKKGLVRKTRTFVRQAIKATGVKTGYLQFTGTGGDMEDGVDDMKVMFYDPKSFDLLEFENYYDEGIDYSQKIARYVPGYRFEIIDDDGNTLYHKSLEALEENRTNQNNDDELHTETSQKPIFTWEIFFVKSGGYFGKMIAKACNERIAYINTHQTQFNIKRGFLIWKDPHSPWKGVEWIADNDGPFQINEMPETYPAVDENGQAVQKVYNDLYKVATDSYDQDEARTSNSKGACAVKKGFLNANHTSNIHVAILLERPETSEGGKDLFYEHTALLTVFYNGINLIEHSKNLIFEWYHRHGLTMCLKKKPEFTIANKVRMTQTTNDYGIDASIIPQALPLLKKFLSVLENIQKCNFTVLLEAWAKFKLDPNYNCDITIATLWLEALEEDEIEMRASMDEDEGNDKTFSYIKKGHKLQTSLN